MYKSLVKEYTVSGINAAIKKLMAVEFSYVKVKGEVTNFKKSGNDHLYFTLKDEKSSINVVMFKWYADFNRINIENGLEIVVSGKVAIYEERSSYQVVAESLEMSGFGSLLKILEERRQKLAAEGLFDEGRKRPIPKLPKKVGLITSANGAAIHDITTTLGKYLPLELMVYDVPVQGKDAHFAIIAAVEYFNGLPADERPDVLALSRGGGSMEDLMPFSEELLVRVVAMSDIPTISAVGHEVDYTLVDFATDLRVPTPTALADSISILKREALDMVTRAIDSAGNILMQKVARAESRMPTAEYITRIVQWRMDGFSSLTGDLPRRLEYVAENILRRWTNIGEKISAIDSRRLLSNFFNTELRLDIVSQKLEFYNYQKILDRGFAIVRDGDRIIKSAEKINPLFRYTIEMKDGRVEVKIV